MQFVGISIGLRYIKMNKKHVYEGGGAYACSCGTRQILSKINAAVMKRQNHIQDHF